MNERQIFLKAAVSAGCPEEQTRNFVAARLWLQERQLAASAAARLCDRPDGPMAIGYGGARGGGKSHWLLAQLGADDCQRVPELKCLLLRKVGKANLEHFEICGGSCSTGCRTSSRRSRMLEEAKRVGETATAIELRQSGEYSILGGVAFSVSESLTQVLRWVYWWNSTEELPDGGFAVPVQRVPRK